MPRASLFSFALITGFVALVAPAPASPPASLAGEVDVSAAPYFAKGDGKTDDTAALQAAIRDHVNSGLTAGNRGRVLYLPPGEYLVSDTLDWRDAKGRNATMLFVRGAGRDRTVIRLRDEAPGFGDPGAPRALVFTRSEHNPAWYKHSPEGEALGEGHLAFYNGLFDLTLDTGCGNPGAIGVDFHTNNMGGLRDVRVRSGDGAGVCGIELTRRNVGPGLLKRVEVEGFDYGIRFRSLYIMTGEHLRLRGQRVASVESTDGVLALRRLVAEPSRGPAIRHEGSGALLVLVDSTLRGSGAEAVEGSALRLLSQVKAEGFASVGRDAEGAALPAAVAHYASPGVRGADAPLRLPVEETPEPPVLAAEDWADVRAFGANPADHLDDSEAIQRALDSGKAGVVFPNWTEADGRYVVHRPLRVPARVRVIDGVLTNFFAPKSGVFAKATPEAPSTIFDVVEATAEPLFIDRVILRNHRDTATSVASVRHASPRPLVLRQFRFNGIVNGLGAGPMFIEDCSAHHPIAGYLRLDHPQNVWARQLNLEDVLLPKILQRGGALWILGMKTERPSTILDLAKGARMELLGGLFYQHHADPQPAIRVADAEFGAAFATATGGPRTQPGYPVLVRQERAGRPPAELLSSQAPRREDAAALSIVPWFSNHSP